LSGTEANLLFLIPRALLAGQVKMAIGLVTWRKKKRKTAAMSQAPVKLFFFLF
jgi:hypothetical protein